MNSFHKKRKCGLSANILSSVPNSLVNLNMVVDLDLSFNKLAAIPEDGWDLMRALRSLWLNSNHITHIPVSICKSRYMVGRGNLGRGNIEALEGEGGGGRGHTTHAPCFEHECMPLLPLPPPPQTAAYRACTFTRTIWKVSPKKSI
jgi:Leucine-rich repeat (LRR) protein